MFYKSRLCVLALVSLACTVVSQSSDAFAVVVTDINHTVSDVSAWNGQILTANGIKSDMTQVNTDIKNIRPNTPDPDSFLKSCQNNFEPALSRLVTQLINRKADIQSAGLSNTIKYDMQNIKNSTDSMGSAWIAKTSSSRQSQVKACLTKLDGDANQGIAAFS